MKKKTFFSVVLIVWCVLCTLSVLQVRNVLANHRQNERDDSKDDSFDEDSPHELVLPPPPEFKPIEPTDIKPRTPGLAYDDSDLVQIIPRTLEFPSDAYWPGDLLYKYDGYWSMRFGEYFRLDDRNKNVDDNIPIPQEPPAFKDMSELYGRMMETDDDRNKDVMENKLIQLLEAKYHAQVLQALQNTFSPDRVRDLSIKIDMSNFTQGERNPHIDRITVSVNIDGTWEWKYDEKRKPVVLSDGSIEREYTPVPLEQLRVATLLVQNAIGYNSARGDSVSVLNIPFDRTKEFSEEDTAYFAKKQMQMTVIIILSSLTLLLISFIIFRGIAGHAKVTDTKNL